MRSRTLATLAAMASTIAFVTALGGCGAYFTENPSFDVSRSDARDYLNQLRTAPRELERPVIVLAGYQDPGFGARSVAARLRRGVLDPAQIIHISFVATPDFDTARRRVIQRIDAEFPSDDPFLTREVDVIGISMGGLIARYAACNDPGSGLKRLRIARLFTISTPHRGADMAGLPSWDEKQLDMRPGSRFLEALNGHPQSCDFEIVPYVRLGDGIVGEENAAPPGADVWWLPNLPLRLAHVNSPSDPRILADIMRRLCGGEPFTCGEPAPLPGE